MNISKMMAALIITITATQLHSGCCNVTSRLVAKNGEARPCDIPFDVTCAGCSTANTFHPLRADDSGPGWTWNQGTTTLTISGTTATFDCLKIDGNLTTYQALNVTDNLCVSGNVLISSTVSVGGNIVFDGHQVPSKNVAIYGQITADKNILIQNYHNNSGSYGVDINNLVESTSESIFLINNRGPSQAIYTGHNILAKKDIIFESNGDQSNGNGIVLAGGPSRMVQAATGSIVFKNNTGSNHGVRNFITITAQKRLAFENNEGGIAWLENGGSITAGSYFTCGNTPATYPGGEFDGLLGTNPGFASNLENCPCR